MGLYGHDVFHLHLPDGVGLVVLPLFTAAPQTFDKSTKASVLSDCPVGPRNSWPMQGNLPGFGCPPHDQQCPNVAYDNQTPYIEVHAYGKQFYARSVRLGTAQCALSHRAPANPG